MLSAEYTVLIWCKATAMLQCVIRPVGLNSANDHNVTVLRVMQFKNGHLGLYDPYSDGIVIFWNMKKYLLNYTGTSPKTTCPTTEWLLPKLLFQLHSDISQNYLSNYPVTSPKILHLQLWEHPITHLCSILCMNSPSTLRWKSRSLRPALLVDAHW
jgi:hypothetical protein